MEFGITRVDANSKRETSVAILPLGIYGFFPYHWVIVIDRILKYLVRRRRHITLRCAVGATAAFIFIVYFLWSVFTSRSKVPEKIRRERNEALLENTDEFLVSVLNDLTFHEVDLYAKADAGYDEYDEEIENDERRRVVGLGEGGVAAAVPPSLNASAEEAIKKEGFNRVLGDLISLNRSTPDPRHPACRSEVYDTILPDMSVIIVFCNEAFSSLVRTVHSVFNRTPPQFLKEIILVDDFSEKKDLRGKLERYVATKFDLNKIRLIRLNSRSGLIRTRMMGAHFATGDVITVLDAHCEVTHQWAEPLLQRIKENRKAVVTPIIDTINEFTMKYNTDDDGLLVGGFNWAGDFTWVRLSEREKKRRRSDHGPTRSPTMAGGLFAMDRKFFWEIGSYDPGMAYWGGENLEISFRIWQCGGLLEIIQCSRVGHIFRNLPPYSIPKVVDVHGMNTARLAEVWMDEFKELFYFQKKGMKERDIGDVTRRLAFRRRKKCKSFKWFLDNIYREKDRLWVDAQFYGQFKNPGTNECIDDMQNSDEKYFTLSSYACHDALENSQAFAISKEGEFRKEEMCARVNIGEDVVWMTNCEHNRKNDKWDFKTESGQLYHRKSKKCLTVRQGEDNKNGTLFLEPCEEGELNEDSRQRWIVDRHEGEDEEDGETEVADDNE